MKSIQNKVVLITGASSGIGEALARVAAKKGAKVAMAARRTERLEELVQEFQKLGTDALALTCDVRDPASLNTAFSAAKEKFGKIDYVIANAGFGVLGAFDRLTDEDYARQFETNIYGVLRTARAALPFLKESKGSFVIMSSVASFVSWPGDTPYSMSKAAVRALGNTLYYEWRPFNISVSVICPAFVKSEIYLVNNRGEFKPNQKSQVPEWIRMDTMKAALAMWKGIVARQHEIIITGHGKFLVWLRRFFPALLRRLFVRLPTRPEKV